MKDDADMTRHLRSFYARSNVIFRKFHHCSASIKVNLIKTYCAPYCSQLWVNHTKCSYNKLRVAYNNAYNLHVVPFDVHFQDIDNAFMCIA